MSVPIELLRCPMTGGALKSVPEDVLRSLVAAQRADTLRNRSGDSCEPFESGLLTIDGARFYPIRSGIPALLASEAVEMAQWKNSPRL